MPSTFVILFLALVVGAHVGVSKWALGVIVWALVVLLITGLVRGAREPDDDGTRPGYFA